MNSSLIFLKNKKQKSRKKLKGVDQLLVPLHKILIQTKLLNNTISEEPYFNRLLKKKKRFLKP